MCDECTWHHETACMCVCVGGKRLCICVLGGGGYVARRLCMCGWIGGIRGVCEYVCVGGGGEVMYMCL